MSNGEADILLVEDNRTDAELIAEALKDSGLSHRLDIVTDGAEALKALKEPDKPHLVLLDLNLPKKSGIEVLRHMKRSPKLSLIPVIILTNSKSRDDVVRAYRAHCNAYVRKPIGFDALLAVIESTIRFWLRTATVANEPPISKLTIHPHAQRDE